MFKDSVARKALTQLCESLGFEFQHHGIGIVTVYPKIFDRRVPVTREEFDALIDYLGVDVQRAAWWLHRAEETESSTRTEGRVGTVNRPSAPKPDLDRATRAERFKAELQALALIVHGFESLPPEAIPRTLTYLQRRFGIYAGKDRMT